MKKNGLWRRMRLWWHVYLNGLTREAAADLIDGLDQGEDCTARPPRNYGVSPLAKALPHWKQLDEMKRPPAHPGMPTLE